MGVAPQLIELSKETEGKYLGIGNLLEDLCLRRASLERSVHAMDTLAESEIGEAAGLAAAKASLAPVFDWALQIAETLESNIASLACCRRRIRGIVRRESDLERAFSQLSFVVTLFRVESVSLEAEKGAMLMALVEEILLLRSRISTLFAEQFASLRRAEALLNGLLVELEQRQARLAAQSREGMETLRSAMEESERQAKSSEERRQRARELSAGVARRIDEVVTASQTQDKVSQNIEHACVSMESLQAEIGGRQRTALRSGRTMRYVEQVALVTSGQMQQASAELGLANEILTVAVSGIVDTAKLIGAERVVSGYGSDFGQVLGSLFATASEQVEACCAVSQRLAEGTSGIVGLATDITGRVGDIAAQLHVIGINTQVHAAKSGVCTGLDALSAKTSDIARDNGAICREVAVELASLATEVAALAANDDLRALDCSRKRDELDQAVACERERDLRFGEQRARLLAEQTDAARGVAELEGGSRAVAELDSLTRSLDCIGSLIDRIGGAAAWYANCLGCSRELDARLKSMAESYTMESERTLHAARLGDGVSEGFGLATGRSTSAKVDEVEWF